MAFNTAREDEELKESLKLGTIKRLFSYMRNYKLKVLVVLAFLMITVAISLINPLLIERAIDVEIAGKNIKGLINIVILAIILNIIFILATKLRMVLMAKVSNHILLDIRNELYEHIQKLDFNFFDSRPTGKVLARIIGDVNSLKDVLSESVTKLIPDFLTVICVIVMMIVINRRLAMAALITLPFLMISMYLIQTIAHKRWRIFRKKNSNMTGFVHENFSGIRIIQSFTAEKETEEEFDVLLHEQKKSFIDAIRIGDMFGPAIEVVWGVGSFLLYYIGIKVIGADEIGVGTLIAFSNYMMMFWGPLRNLADFYNKLITNLTAAERIFEIMDTKIAVRDEEEVTELPEINGAVAFENVSFSYSDAPDEMVLKNVSFSVEPGKTIALVGPTGAGKTTIVNLISRFYNITKGKITIDNFDVEKVSIRSVRLKMGVMSQDNYLFSGTIKDNIRYGKLDATDEEIVEAAKAVSAHNFIMQLENGYDTEINERGIRLSIGQRQLIAFARTMIKSPQILILDEATSSIDTHTELLVQKGIKTLLKGRTSFIIAHRLSTIKNADEIYVIDEGIIKERGTHNNLMKQRGKYYELYNASIKF